MRRIGRIGLMGLTALALAGCVAVPKTKITGTIAGQPFSISSPKDSELRGLEVMAASNGVVTIKIESLSAKMNPDVISTTAAGQAAMINGIAGMVTNAVSAAVSAGVSAAK